MVDWWVVIWYGFGSILILDRDGGMWRGEAGLYVVTDGELHDDASVGVQGE